MKNENETNWETETMKDENDILVDMVRKEIRKFQMWLRKQKTDWRSFTQYLDDCYLCGWIWFLRCPEEYDMSNITDAGLAKILSKELKRTRTKEFAAAAKAYGLGKKIAMGWVD